MKKTLLLVALTIVLFTLKAQRIVTLLVANETTRVEFRFDEFNDYGTVIVIDYSDYNSKLFDEFRIYYKDGYYEVVKLNEHTLASSKVNRISASRNLYMRGYKIGFKRTLIKNKIEKVCIYYDGKLNAEVKTIGKRE